MSDTPIRQISTLPKRAGIDGAGAKLMRANRPAAPGPEVPVVAVDTEVELPVVTKAAPPARKPASSAATAPKVKDGPYVDADLLRRARAAHKATRDDEGDSSWSNFVEKAILAETERREQLYNQGQQFPDRGKLPTGRPLRN